MCYEHDQTMDFPPKYAAHSKVDLRSWKLHFYRLGSRYLIFVVCGGVGLYDAVADKSS